MLKNIIFISLLGFISACSTQKNAITQKEEITDIVASEEDEDEIYDAGIDEEYTEERTLDELVVTAPRDYKLPTYNAAADREWDLLHMDLDLRFDWTNERVFGRADLQLKPYFYDQKTLTLDAKGFEIFDVFDAVGKTLEYEYNGSKLVVDLEQIYNRDQTVVLTVDYVAQPSAMPEGGSAAITSDKGLFFINPRGEEANKPRQIWTQGETEHNSKWFPTIDKPNEQLTHQISITVEEKFVTLSNGTKISSKSNAGTRTDTWKMDMPHAPYLVMIAVGDFAVVTEEVDGLLLEYYVEKEYEPYAKQIFAHTPEMISYFSDVLDYPYPWDKYSQIITKDYVSGAMENTTAVIFGDFIQKTDRELIDDDNDFIVAHELFHHWFGDLVTVESWANLTLQEGFANYSEHLWQEHKYGLDAAGFQRNNEKQGYLASIMQSGTHPLIHYGYGDKEEMFDGHSYNKGGLVLHMLRKELGDEAFFEGLNKYLNDNVHSAVEVDELRMAFEDVTGLDLHWFFDQWYLSAGHPNLELAYDYDATAKELIVSVDQTQNTESAKAIFQLPVTLSAFNADGTESQYNFTINERSYEVALLMEEEPALIVFDRYDHLLMVKSESKTTEEYMRQYEWVDTYIHRAEAIDKIKSKKEAQPLLEKALTDNHFSIRKKAVENIKLFNRADLVMQIEKMAKSDEHSAVRAAAVKKLRGVEGIDISKLTGEIMSSDRSYNVISAALETLNKEDKEAALSEAVKLKSEKTALLVGAVSDILAGSGDVSHLPYFEDRLTSVSLFSAFNFYDSYYDLLSKLDVPAILSKSQKLKDIATSPGENVFYRFTSTNTLDKIRTKFQKDNAASADLITAMIEEIKAKETNQLLVQRYMSY